jgi:hypothetical protein
LPAPTSDLPLPSKRLNTRAAGANLALAGALSFGCHRAAIHPPSAPPSAAYVLAAGDPAILQLDDTTANPLKFEYAWLTRVRRDNKGQVVEVRGSTVGCGPSSGSPGGQPALYPGVTAQSGGCVADSVDSLRAAAKSSTRDGPPQDVFNARWLRAGDR